METEWVAQFEQIHYEINGYRAHWVTLAVVRVTSEYVSLKRESMADLTDDVDNENDQDLGFSDWDWKLEFNKYLDSATWSLAIILLRQGVPGPSRMR